MQGPTLAKSNMGMGDKINALKHAVKDSIEATFGNSATPGSLDGVSNQLAGETPQHVHAQELCRTAVNKIIGAVDFKSAPEEQVKARQTTAVQTKKELEEKTLKIQLKATSTLPTIFNPQNTAIIRSVEEIADKRVLLNKIFLELPEEIASKAKLAMPLQGHANDDDQLFVEIKSNGSEGKRAVYLTHQLKKEDPEDSTRKVLYLGNLPKREKTVVVPLPVQPLPAQLQKQLTVVTPAQPGATPPAQPGVVNPPANAAGTHQPQPLAASPFPAPQNANLVSPGNPQSPLVPNQGFPPAGQ